MRSDGVSTSDVPSESAVKGLERELEHCIRQSIMYKLDVKGYKQDLRKAQATLQSLQAMGPLTPDRDSVSSTASTGSSEMRQQSRIEHNLLHDSGDTASGLGIHLIQPSQTPTKSLASATGVALIAITPQILPTSSSSSTRPSTPLGSHKKLTKPPASRTPSPLPAHTPSSARLQRGETVRSLSESIISSYAKRSPPELGAELSPSARERNSDPLAPPTSRFRQT